MAIKVVIIFQEVTLSEPGFVVTPIIKPQIGYASRQHIGGWTESVMFPTDSVKDCLTALQAGANGQMGLLPARAGILNWGSQIVGLKMYQGGAGKGQSQAVSYVGNPIFTSDIPQMALLCKGQGLNTTSTRRWTLRGIPDDEVSTGELQPGAAFTIFLTNYFGALGNFGFRGIDPVNSKTAVIFTIDVDGNVKTNNGVNPFAVPSIVNISRTVDINGVLRSFKSTISAGAAGTQFKVDNWPFGACSGGKAIQNAYNVFPFNVGTIAASRITTRRVGRPFEQYRGRRSKRRKTA